MSNDSIFSSTEHDYYDLNWCLVTSMYGLLLCRNDFSERVQRDRGVACRYQSLMMIVIHKCNLKYIMICNVDKSIYKYCPTITIPHPEDQRWQQYCPWWTYASSRFNIMFQMYVTFDSEVRLAEQLTNTEVIHFGFGSPSENEQLFIVRPKFTGVHTHRVDNCGSKSKNLK